MAEWKDTLAELRVAFLRRAGEHVVEGLRLVDDLAAQPGARPTLELLHAVFHKLTGSAGTYGYPEVSVKARTATDATETLLESLQAPDATALAVLRATLIAIAARLDDPPEG